MYENVMIENCYENEKLEFINKYIKNSLDYCKNSGTIGVGDFFEYNKEIDISYTTNNNIKVFKIKNFLELSYENLNNEKTLEKVLIDRQKCFNEKDLDNVINKLREEIEESELKVFVFKLELNNFNNNILLTYVIK